MGIGERAKTFFHEKKKFSLSPQTPLSLSKKAAVLLRLPLVGAEYAARVCLRRGLAMPGLFGSSVRKFVRLFRFFGGGDIAPPVGRRGVCCTRLFAARFGDAGLFVQRRLLASFTFRFCFPSREIITTAATQQQGARSHTGRRRRSSFFTTFEILTRYK